MNKSAKALIEFLCKSYILETRVTGDNIRFSSNSINQKRKERKNESKEKSKDMAVYRTGMLSH